MDIQEFSFPTRILFGAGAISRTAAELKNAGKKRPLLVADRHVARLPFVRSLEADLKSAGLDISEFHEFSGNPVESHVMYGAAAFKNHRADSLVIIGGGATLDTGKAIALMAGHPGKLFDYREDGPGRFDQPIPWMVAIPTTAGTGSEGTRAPSYPAGWRPKWETYLSYRALSPSRCVHAVHPNWSTAPSA